MRKKYLNVSETAAFLGLSPNTIYALAQSGRLPADKHKGAWRFLYGGVFRFNQYWWSQYWIRRNKQLLRNPLSLPPRRSLMERRIYKAYEGLLVTKRGTGKHTSKGADSLTPNPGSSKKIER